MGGIRFRDDTPGCTAQACSLRDHNQEIAARRAAIIDESGHIAHIIDHPDSANHGAEVLKFI